MFEVQTAVTVIVLLILTHYREFCSLNCDINDYNCSEETYSFLRDQTGLKILPVICKHKNNWEQLRILYFATKRRGTFSQ